jgi:AraC-like DNA-binding protein
MEMISICIKGLLSNDCPPELLTIFNGLGAEVVEIQLGVIRLRKPLYIKMESIDLRLREANFVWIKDKQAQMVERVKALVFLMLKDQDFQKSRLNVSHYLSNELGRSYAHISRVFSNLEAVTIEHYIIEQRIAFAKELLLYGSCTLVEVASRLGYSSVQHLSRQFHQITGETVRKYLQELVTQKI